MNALTKTYVLEFRISELKSVLNQLSLSTTGRKAELQSRIFQYFGEPFKGGPTSDSPAKEQWRLQAASGSPCLHLHVEFLSKSEQTWLRASMSGMPPTHDPSESQDSVYNRCLWNLVLQMERPKQ